VYFNATKQCTLQRQQITAANANATIGSVAGYCNDDDVDEATSIAAAACHDANVETAQQASKMQSVFFSARRRDLLSLVDNAKSTYNRAARHRRDSMHCSTRCSMTPASSSNNNNRNSSELAFVAFGFSFRRACRVVVVGGRWRCGDATRLLNDDVPDRVHHATNGGVERR
jgi:hypothetical protein